MTGLEKYGAGDRVRRTHRRQGNRISGPYSRVAPANFPLKIFAPIPALPATFGWQLSLIDVGRKWFSSGISKYYECPDSFDLRCLAFSLAW